MVETSATCGLEMATSIQVAHKVQEQSQLEDLSKYDVFLNHRGCDVKSFVSHLDATLRRYGREPFLDAKSLIKGNHAFYSINEALSGVYCHVAIFSPRYAESKYCLNELCDMLASKKPICLVFYNVEPEDLRWPENEKGPFAKALNHHIERGRNQDVMKWKEALRMAADITGFRLVDSDNEVKLVEKVTSAVLKALPPPPPLVSARHPVGLKKSLAHVVGMLHKMGETVGVLGIHGMGGIGKTTLAKEIYNYGQAEFQKRCFLQDLKDAKGTALMDLQMQLVKDLLGEDVKKMVGDYVRCMEMIGKHKVLIVVDDVSSRKQFHEIISDINLLAPGSRVVITCRAIDILNDIMLDVPQHALYGIEELSLSNSLELFIWCAFQKVKLDDVEDSFHESVYKIAKACGGLPLALEVMGGFLANKKNDQEYWIKAAFALKNYPNVMTCLKINYEGLADEDDKSMFVDIACFMLGHSKDIALAVWDSMDKCEASICSLKRLMDNGLVKVVDGGLLNMHDLLRDMGRNIVKEIARERDKMQSHVWDPSMATRIIQNKEGLKQILALSLIGADPSITWQAKSFEKMKKLRYLFLDGCLVHGDFSRWPKELRWLQWRHFCGDEIPQSLRLSNLAVLDLANSPNLTHLWTVNFEEEIPCKNLQVLILTKCTNLKDLPQQMEKLLKLKLLNLEECNSLNSLPSSLGDVIGLQKLYLNGCELLQKLPTSISKLSKLTELSVGRTAIQELPTDFGQLGGLKRVWFSDCKSLRELPESFEGLSNLEELNLDGCELLQKLPTSISKLSKVTELSVQRTAIQELPMDFGQLSGLKRVWFSDCKSLCELPESFEGLSNLEVLNLDGCELLQKLPISISKLSKLTELSMQRTAIQELPMDFGQLGGLKRVCFSECKSLRKLPESFEGLSNLEVLNLDGCGLLQKLPTSISKLSKLTEFSMQRTAIQELSTDFGQLGGVKRIWFSDCKSLHELPASFEGLSNLEVLNLDGCELLQKLPTSISKLSKLTELNVGRTLIQELPTDFGQLGGLKRVWFSDCKSLHELPESFEGLSNLEELNLDGCELLQKLPTSISKLSKVTKLSVQRTAIQELPTNFGQLVDLKRVWFSDCKSLRELPESFEGLSNLEVLNLDGCELLQKLPISISKLSKLTELSMQRTAIQELPTDFGQLSGLKRIWFSDCKSLRELPESFEGLSNLEVLNLDGCELLQKLPTSKLVDLVSCLPKMGEMVAKLRVINNNLGRLNDHFECIEQEDLSGKWQFGVVAERHKREYLGFSAKVVKEASVRHGYKKNLSVGADHFGVCKPEDRRNNSYKSLTQFIAEFFTWIIFEAGQNRVEMEDDELTSLDIFQTNVNFIQPQWLEDVKSLISATMVSLGIRQTPTIIERGANQLVQLFKGNTKGIVAGRLDTTGKEIQIILSDLETMVDVIGVGLKTEKFVLVTLGGGYDPSKAIMSVIEETYCEKLNSSGDAFYLLHFTEDVYEDQDYHARGLLQGDYSSCTAYRVHIVAKLLLLMKCEDLDDETFWLKIKDLSLYWDWQDLRIAMCKCESISNLDNENDVQCQERGGTRHGGTRHGGTRHGGTRHGGSGSEGSCQNSNSSSCSDNKGKGKINDNQDAEGNHDENDMDGGDEEDDEDDDRNGEKSSSTCTNPMERERESYSIEVRPGYDEFKIIEGENWSYKTVHATVTPSITITFKKAIPFQNCSNEVIKGREVQVRLDVNLALGESEPYHEEMQKFAWFHDYFEFSFMCKKERAAGLKPNSGFIHGLKDQKATRGKGSTLNSEQWNIQAQGGVKAGPPVAQATFQTTLSRFGPTSTTHDEESRDTTRIQTAQGFDVVQKFNGGGKPSFGAKFTYGDIDIQSQCLKEDGTCKKESYNLPICSSQDMSLEGTFLPLEEAKNYYKYTFQCKRDIKGWFWMKPEPTPTQIDSAPTSASSSTWVSSSSSTPTSTSSSTWVSPSSSTPTSTSSSTWVSATSSHCRKEQSNSFLRNLSCMSFGKGINEGALKRFKSIKESWILKTCKQSFEFDIHINHAMNHIHRLANQYPNGIPAIGPKYEYESVIATSTIHHKSTSCDGLKSACSRPD